MTSVLLSASFPSGDRGEQVRPYNTGDIAAAASSAAEAVLRSDARLVFGGHPTISPIVLQIAGVLGKGRQVDIWQSEYFADQITDEVRRLVDQERAQLHWVPRGADLRSSLRLFREAMLATDLRAAFFVGGMDGVLEELELLRRGPGAPAVFAYVTPGGMAARLAQELRRSGDDHGPATGATDGQGGALVGRAYGSLAMSALREVDLDVHGRPEEL